VPRNRNSRASCLYNLSDALTGSVVSTGAMDSETTALSVPHAKRGNAEPNRRRVAGPTVERYCRPGPAVIAARQPPTGGAA
jgi:hypothetical protein